ncbi:uracil-DNA glycosylase [Hellea balneolensis]|uniref:uracil-DNA glycosylase n=1 Tax=Hellea balneolensis TaxID=287478 RepID=UPI00042380FF|nr:uracil-DNA glycosylase [Hellea balneolensis]
MDKALKSVLEWWDAAGVDVPEVRLSTPRRKATPPASQPQSAQKKAAPPTNSPSSKPIMDAAPIAAKAKTLAELKASMDKFDAGALSDAARQCVFARGNPEADLMVIGEAPGRDEDITGKPFVGRSGQLLDKMLASIGLTEDDFYITNVVNWRPPKNRNPTADEIDMCRPFLDRHIELAAPKVLLIVGGVSLSAMTGLTGIMKQRGQWQSVTAAGVEIPALPIYHPAFLLRQPVLKKDAWRDLLALREQLNPTK